MHFDLSHHLRHKHGLDMNKVTDMIAKDDVDMKTPITCLHNKFALITFIALILVILKSISFNVLCS